MLAYLLIILIESVVLVAVWRWDERTRRAELDRRRQQRRAQASGRGFDDAGRGSSASPAGALPGTP